MHQSEERDMPTTTTTQQETAAMNAAVQPVQVYRVYIRTTPEQVWEAITAEEWTDRYGYGGRNHYDLRPGGAYTAETSEEMRAMGAPDLAIDGEVLECEPPHRLVTTWRMLMDDAMKGEGFTQVSYDIEESAPGLVKLTVTHELQGSPQLQLLMSGQWESQGAGGGWSWVLSDLKSVLETGEKLPR
jgi:uncharacterized protein YndB with AHSA1/START domain